MPCLLRAYWRNVISLSIVVRFNIVSYSLLRALHNCIDNLCESTEKLISLSSERNFLLSVDYIVRWSDAVWRSARSCRGESMQLLIWLVSVQFMIVNKWCSVTLMKDLRSYVACLASELLLTASERNMCSLYCWQRFSSVQQSGLTQRSLHTTFTHAQTSLLTAHLSIDRPLLHYVKELNTDIPRYRM